MVARVFEMVSGLWGRPLLDDLLGGTSFSPSADGGASVFLLNSGFGDGRGGCNGSLSACCDDGRIGRDRGAGATVQVRTAVLPPLPVPRQYAWAWSRAIAHPAAMARGQG